MTEEQLYKKDQINLKSIGRSTQTLCQWRKEQKAKVVSLTQRGKYYV